METRGIFDSHSTKTFIILKLQLLECLETKLLK
jgi:hypothetical protein